MSPSKYKPPKPVAQSHRYHRKVIHLSIFVMFNKYPKGFPASKAKQKVYRVVQLCT